MIKILEYCLFLYNICSLYLMVVVSMLILFLYVIVKLLHSGCVQPIDLKFCFHSSRLVTLLLSSLSARGSLSLARLSMFLMQSVHAYSSRLGQQISEYFLGMFLEYITLPSIDMPKQFQ